MDSNQSWPHRARRLLFGDTARQGYFAAADQALISLTNFLATVMVARYATPTDLGVYHANILFASFPAELLPPGRVYNPYYKKTTFAIQADNQALRAYVEKFMAGTWPDQPEEPACP